MYRPQSLVVKSEPAVPPCVLSLVVAVAPVAVGHAQQQPAQPPVFRSGVTTVSVSATVRDSRGRFVPHLTKDDFELRVGGKPTEIAVFSSDEQPITVCLLIDSKRSTNPVLDVRSRAA